MSGFKPFRYKDEVSKSVEKRKESLGAKPNTKKPVSELPATYRSKSISNGKRTNSDSNEKEKLRRLNSNESSGLHSRLDSSSFSNLNDSAICSDDTFEDEQHLPAAPPSLKSVSNVKNQNNPPEANQKIQNYESTRPPSNVPTEPINCPSMTDEPMEQVDNPVSALSIPELFTVYDQLLPVLNDVTPNSFCIRSKRDQLSSMIGTITKVLKDSRVALESCQGSESTKQLKDEISRLEADNFEQLRKNRECMKKIADSEAEILHLKRNPQRLPSIDVHKSEKEALVLELETSKRENHRLNNVMKAYEKEIGVLKESFKAKIDENENLRSELENTKLQLNNYPNTIQQLEEKNNEIKTLNETIQKLTEEIEKVKKQLADATANNAEPQTVKHFLQKLTELEDKYEDEKARSARRGKNFSMQKADFDRVHKERNELKEKLGQLTKENENLNERILQLEKRVDETSQFEIIQNAMVRFDAEVLKKNAEVADLNAEISKLTEKENFYITRISNLEKSSVDSKKRIDTLNQQLAERNGKLTKDFIFYGENLKQKDMEIEELKKKIEDYEELTENLKEMETKLEENENLAEKYKKMKSKLKTKKLEIEELKIVHQKQLDAIVETAKILAVEHDTYLKKKYGKVIYEKGILEERIKKLEEKQIKIEPEIIVTSEVIGTNSRKRQAENMVENSSEPKRQQTILPSSSGTNFNGSRSSITPDDPGLNSPDQLPYCFQLGAKLIPGFGDPVENLQYFRGLNPVQQQFLYKCLYCRLLQYGVNPLNIPNPANLPNGIFPQNPGFQSNIFQNFRNLPMMQPLASSPNMDFNSFFNNLTNFGTNQNPATS